MQIYQTQPIVTSIIDHIFININNAIATIQILPLIPAFSSNIVNGLISQLTLSSQVQCQVNCLPLQQQKVISIKHLQKDSLMPKELSQQKIRIESPKKKSPSSIGSTKRISSIKKKDSSKLAQRLQSITLYDNRSSKNGSEQRTGKDFIALNDQTYDQEEGTFHLRQRTQNRLNQMEKQKNWRRQRQQKFKAKLQEYKNIVGQSNQVSVTYDYQGDALKNTKIKQQKSQELKMMRTGMGFTSKKFKEGYSIITDSQHFDIQINKKIKAKDQAYITMKASNIPVFPMKMKQEMNMKNLKLQQYRRAYDFKYSRSNFGGRQVQMNKTMTVNHEQQEIIQKKIIKQADKVEHMRKTMRTVQNQRKIALPRLHGKYKVLDRYEQP